MKIDVKHIAKLANLTLSEKEVKMYEEQLSTVIGYVDKLQEVNTKDVQETSQTTGLTNVSKKDTLSSSLPQEEAISQAKREKNGLFVVKGILSND